MIAALILAYPDAVKEKEGGYSKMLPLHLSCQNKAPGGAAAAVGVDQQQQYDSSPLCSCCMSSPEPCKCMLQDGMFCCYFCYPRDDDDDYDDDDSDDKIGCC